MFIIFMQGYFGPNKEIVNGMGGVASFFEEAGKRWIRTGDIGEFDVEGNTKQKFWNFLTLHIFLIQSLEILKYPAQIFSFQAI